MSEGADPWYEIAPCTCARPAHTGQVYRAVVLALNRGVIGSRVPEGTITSFGFPFALRPLQFGDGSTAMEAAHTFPFVSACVYAAAALSDNPPVTKFTSVSMP